MLDALALIVAFLGMGFLPIAVILVLARGRSNRWVDNGSIDYNKFNREISKNIGGDDGHFASGYLTKPIVHTGDKVVVLSAQRLVKGIALANRVTLFTEHALHGDADAKGQLIFDILKSLKLTVKCVDVSSDTYMYLGLPEKNGSVILPYVYLDGLPFGDAQSVLADVQNGKFFDWLDRGKIEYDRTVASQLQKT